MERAGLPVPPMTEAFMINVGCWCAAALAVIIQIAAAQMQARGIRMQELYSAESPPDSPRLFFGLWPVFGASIQKFFTKTVRSTVSKNVSSSAVNVLSQVVPV
jgi:hypothetical protein